MIRRLSNFPSNKATHYNNPCEKHGPLLDQWSDAAQQSVPVAQDKILVDHIDKQNVT